MIISSLHSLIIESEYFLSSSQCYLMYVGHIQRGRRQEENGKKIENKYRFIHNTQMYKVQDKIPGLVGVGST